MTEKVCSVEGCGKRHKGLGLCNTHYTAFRRQSGAPCAVSGCAAPSVCRGWCSTHYQRWTNHGDPLAIFRPSKVDDPCSVPGCGREHFGKGYCFTHYGRFRRFGDALAARPPMALRCVICDHPQVDGMEDAVRSGSPVKGTARRFGVDGRTLRRHTLNHMDNPGWHARRAAYWVGKLSEVQASRDVTPST